MGKRSRATQGQPNPLLQYVDGSKSEAFARSLVSLRVRIAKPMKGKGKPTHVREGLVRRAENEVSQKPNGNPYFPVPRPVGDGSVGPQEWSLEVVPDDDSRDSKAERKKELDKAVANLHFKGGCGAAKAVIAEKGPEALVHQRISFWWPFEQEWFPGVIMSVSLADRSHARMTIKFDDGDELTRTVASSIWRLESTEPTEENKQASIVKSVAATSLQEAVRPHNLKAVYKAAPIRVEQADQEPLHICTVDAGAMHNGRPLPSVQEEHPTGKERHEYAFVFPEPVSADDMQATISESGKIRVSVPVRT